MTNHRSDTGPFALVPVWVLDLPISHLAVRIYAVHSDWADRSGAHYHGRKTIAERVGCSLDAVDDAHRALVKHQALTIERRRDGAGDPTSNRYIIRRAMPGVAEQERLPSRAAAATGSGAGAALTRSKDLNHTHVSLPSPISNEAKAFGLAQIRKLRHRDDEAAG